ncbi:MAG: hypothetical protein A2Y25_05235 [Candidatus Melainabacteria bacterium GWF2_37_15]|nr:MAG: hypothetical protein A2Y25_05235 [Candidatus Melainabacteria bacterium GWF2_37_15]
MNIGSVSQNLSASYQKQANQRKQVSFGKQSQQKYENPVNKKMEYYGTVLSSSIFSTIVGVGAGLLANMKAVKEAVPALTKTFLKMPGPVAVGLAAGAATFLLTGASALYHKSVQVFAKEKEFDVYSRAKSAETSLSEQIDQQARNPEVPLEESVNNYAKFNIARVGKGMGVFGV